jgi:hypothetical protein
VAVLHNRRVVRDALLLKLLIVSILPSGIRVCVMSAVFMHWSNEWTDLDGSRAP